MNLSTPGAHVQLTSDVAGSVQVEADDISLDLAGFCVRGSVIVRAVNFSCTNGVVSAVDGVTIERSASAAFRAVTFLNFETAAVLARPGSRLELAECTVGPPKRSRQRSLCAAVVALEPLDVSVSKLEVLGKFSLPVRRPQDAPSPQQKPPHTPCCLTDAPNSGMCSSPTYVEKRAPSPPVDRNTLPKGAYSVFLRGAKTFNLEDVTAAADLPTYLVNCGPGSARRCSPSPVLLGSTPHPLGWCAPPPPAGFSGAWFAGSGGGTSSFTQARPVGNTQNVQVAAAVALNAPFLCSLNNEILGLAA